MWSSVTLYAAYLVEYNILFKEYSSISFHRTQFTAVFLFKIKIIPLFSNEKVSALTSYTQELCES